MAGVSYLGGPVPGVDTILHYADLECRRIEFYMKDCAVVVCLGGILITVSSTGSVL